MPVAVNQNFDVRAGVVHGSLGYLRDIRCSTDDEGKRQLTSCIVQIPDCDPVEMPNLPKHHFPILPDTTYITLEHSASHNHCSIKRRQVPIEPGFAMTVYKAQGQTMSKVVVDLAGCSGTEQPYAMVSRSTSMVGLIVLRNFKFGQITKRRSEDLRKEFSRLESLGLHTIIKYGSEDQVNEAKRSLNDLQPGSKVKKRKGTGGEDTVPTKKSR